MASESKSQRAARMRAQALAQATAREIVDEAQPPTQYEFKNGPNVLANCDTCGVERKACALRIVKLPSGARAKRCHRCVKESAA